MTLTELPRQHDEDYVTHIQKERLQADSFSLLEGRMIVSKQLFTDLTDELERLNDRAVYYGDYPSSKSAYVEQVTKLQQQVRLIKRSAMGA